MLPGGRKHKEDARHRGGGAVVPAPASDRFLLPQPKRASTSPAAQDPVTSPSDFCSTSAHLPLPPNIHRRPWPSSSFAFRPPRSSAAPLFSRHRRPRTYQPIVSKAVHRSRHRQIRPATGPLPLRHPTYLAPVIVDDLSTASRILSPPVSPSASGFSQPTPPLRHCHSQHSSRTFHGSFRIIAPSNICCILIRRRLRRCSSSSPSHFTAPQGQL